MRAAALLTMLFFALPAYLPAQAGAQIFDIPGAQTAVTIAMSPEFPAPKSSARLTLKSPLYDLERALISWRVGGEAHSEGEGLTSITVTTGEAGESLDVSATMLTEDGEAIAFTSITPAGLDLLWEGEGLTPPFYRGRTLPSVGSQTTLVAYPTFIRDGNRIAEKDLVYTWRRDGTVLGSLSGRGKSTALIESPMLFGAEIVSVEARTPDNAIRALASVRLTSAETPLRLYQNHPLFGPLYHTALGKTAFVPETEMTFLAIPYFAPARTENDPVLVYEWRVNRENVTADKAKPAQITINAEGSDGIALIELALSHVSNFFFGTDGAWQVTFSSRGDASETNPFGPQ